MYHRRYLSMSLLIHFNVQSFKRNEFRMGDQLKKIYVNRANINNHESTVILHTVNGSANGSMQQFLAKTNSFELLIRNL